MTPMGEITNALADLDEKILPTVLDYITSIRRKAVNLPAEAIACSQQFDLVYELKQVYALVDTCRMALDSLKLCETDSTVDVLMSATDTLYHLYEQQKAKAQQMEAALDAEPDPAESLAASREIIAQAAANSKARITADAAETLKSQFDKLWSNYTKGVGESGIDPNGLLEPDLLELSETIDKLHNLHSSTNREEEHEPTHNGQ